MRTTVKSRDRWKVTKEIAVNLILITQNKLNYILKCIKVHFPPLMSERYGSATQRKFKSETIHKGAFFILNMELYFKCNSFGS